MRHGYDYPELFKEDQIVRRWRYEVKRLRVAIQSARETFDQATDAFSNLERALRPRAGQNSETFQR